MIKCAAVLSGNGVTMRLPMELLRMERLYMLMGGDHGEEIHDGNFCMDGLVYPDRTVHTGLLEYKNVYRPARVISYDKESGELMLHNYMDFDDLKDYVKISYELTQDGLVISKGKLPEVSVAPHSEGKTNLKINVPENGKCYLKLIYHLKKNYHYWMKNIFLDLMKLR